MRENPNAADKLIPTRQSLLSRLKNWKDNDSWTVFFDTYWRLIYSTALKAGLTEAEAEDVVQETVLDVSRSMPGFKYDPAKGSFKGWLLKLTSWRVKDQLRKRQQANTCARRGSSDSTATDPTERTPDPATPELEAIWDQEWDRNLMEAALDRVKQKVDPKHFQAFDFYVLREWPVSRVARALKMNRARVYLAKHRISLLIRKEVAALRMRPL